MSGLKTTVLALGLLTLLPAGEALAQSCLSLSGSPYCRGQRASAQVGNVVIFPHGRTARRIGNYIALPTERGSRLAGGLPPRSGSAAPLGARPAGSLLSLDSGRRIGAYEFSTGTAGRLSSRP